MLLVAAGAAGAVEPEPVVWLLISRPSVG